MMLSVAPIYALPVAFICLVLWMRVSSIRADKGISFGDGGDATLLQRIRQHGNCSEWSSFVLILMILAEGMGASSTWLHVSGSLLLIGRIAHPFGLRPDTAGHPLRYVGNGTNMLAALCSMICITIYTLGL
jgi:uncharacterized membrane protein YecN with MAPEG domain